MIFAGHRESVVSAIKKASVSISGFRNGYGQSFEYLVTTFPSTNKHFNSQMYGDKNVECCRNFRVSRSIWQAADELPYVYFRANNDLRQPTRGAHRKM